MNSFFRKLFVSTYALHVLFWSLQIFSNALSEITIFENNPAIYFLNLFSLHALQIFVCCFNIFFLVPRLYRSGHKLIYCCIVAALVISYSVSVSQMQQLFFRNYFSEHITLSKSIYHFSLNAMSIIRYLLITVLIALAREWLLRAFRKSDQKVEQATGEIQFLRSQLNPHFLFNTLNSIYGLVLTRSEMAKEVILKLSDIMKYTLYESNEEKVTLKQDIENVLNYIELEKIRQGNNAVIETSIRFGTGDQLVAPLLFLPLIENAFKHGVNLSIKDGFFFFKLEADGSSIYAEVCNNMNAKYQVQEGTHNGIGLNNLKRRLELFYPGKHSFQIDTNDANFTAKLLLTLDE